MYWSTIRRFIRRMNFSERMGDMELRIAHLYPDLLNLYGDRGNIQCLRMRCLWRGIGAQVTHYRLTDPVDFLRTDIVLLGGGSDREQKIVCTRLRELKEDFKSFVEDGGCVLAICGGYQLMGHYYDAADGRMEGLSILDICTEQGSPRLIGNVVLRSEDSGSFPYEIVGFENHGGRTYIGANKPFGKVLSGYGNNGEDGGEGVLMRNVIGTYLHGPLLPKNPHVCDYLLRRALERKYGSASLQPLDDREELEANRYAAHRFG